MTIITRSERINERIIVEKEISEAWGRPVRKVVVLDVYDPPFAEEIESRFYYSDETHERGFRYYVRKYRKQEGLS